MPGLAGGAAGAGSGESSGDAGGLLDEIARWAASERVARAAAERSRARSLAAQSAATATWAGVLVDLAERAADVSAAVAGTRIQGRLVGVARDFCVIESPGGHPAVIRLDAITELSATGGSTPGGSRPPASPLALVDVLEAAAGEASPVTLHTASGTVTGELLALGEDVVTLRDPGPSRRQVHVPLAAVAACILR